MRVLIYITNKPRDLATFAKLVQRLELAGHDARIVLPWDTWTLARWKPHAIVVHTTEDGWLRRCIRAARRRGIRVINLLAEGTISEYVAPSWAGKDTGPKLDDVSICWGPAAGEYLVKFGRSPEKVEVAGNPRFDVYAGQLPGKNEFCRIWSLDANRPLVVYPTSLVPPVGIDKLDHKLANYTDHAFPRQMALRETTTDAFLGLAESLPNVQFVVKPHPYDTPELFDQGIAARGLSNVVVLQKVGVAIQDVLSACDIMVHWNSTTSTEAWFLDKPTIFMHFDAEIDYLLTQFKDGSDLVRTPDQLRERVEHYLAGGRVDPKIMAARAAYIDAWYGTVDGHALDRVVGVVLDQLEQASQSISSGFGVSELWTLGQVLARKVLRRAPPEPLLPWKSNQPLYPTEPEIAAALAEARNEAAIVD